MCVFNIPVLTCSVQCMKSLCIVVSPERTGGATVKELSSPDGEWEEGEERKRELYRSYRGQSGAGLDGTCVYMKCIQLSEPHLLMYI